MRARDLVAAERAELVAFLRTLSEAEWNAPSLCDGWQVRDVVGHLLYDTIPLAGYLVSAVRHRGSADAVNAHFVERARSLSTAQLIESLESTVHSGLLSALAPRITLADVVIHHQDIRRPLGKPRTIDPVRLRAVLDFPDPFARPGRWTHGLRFVATDIDWSRGQGPEVRGMGEAIALATVGRRIVLDELEGDGAPILADRMQAATS